jgi:hypothetical protein
LENTPDRFLDEESVSGVMKEDPSQVQAYVTGAYMNFYCGGDYWMSHDDFGIPGIKLATDTGAVIGERSLDVVSGEEEVVNGTKEIYPGLYVCGMAASAVSGTPRMGPIFGGMLLSGKRVSNLIIEKLKHSEKCLK